MKKKSGNSRERTAQTAPLVRGPLNCKAKGDLAELAFLYKAASLGFGVAQPYGDKERYDFILDSGERFWRVQVKSTSGAEADHTGYLVSACHNSPNNKIEPYRADEIDFFAAYIVPLGIWYVVPVNQLGSHRFMRFYPSGCRSGGGCFEAFREAWHLMAPAADLPQPRTLRNARTINRHRKRFVE
ncbi:MAG TPA: group I intron-associated PD-(D/E)XK endonuclease [Terriglobales bacterium]|nr:group I intron-associated PD-(D/E)XK endonuclease [Terriglobales bacterium]